MKSDTHPEIERFVRERLMRMDGAERMRLGAGAFDSARVIVESSLPKNLSPAERLIETARRFYGELGARAARERLRLEAAGY